MSNYILWRKWDHLPSLAEEGNESGLWIEDGAGLWRPLFMSPVRIKATLLHLLTQLSPSYFAGCQTRVVCT